MIDVAISTAISFAVLATATIPALISSRCRHRPSTTKNVNFQSLPQITPTVDDRTVDKLIEEGYAYSIDLGDSRMVIVVLSTTKHAGEPIDVHVLDALPNELAEATT